MGVGVSGWPLARAVSVTGQLGVVSGVALDTLLARRLQLGDPGGDIRRALASFPSADVSDQILGRYFVEGGLDPGQPFRLVPRLSLDPTQEAVDLIVAANFVEIFLAKEGHDGLVGVNYLEKIQMATPAAAYGAMLAGVDYVLVGAGIPAELPGLLDTLATGHAGEVSVDVIGAGAARYTVGVRPELVSGANVELHRPKFLAIVASHVLASYLARDARTRPDGVRSALTKRDSRFTELVTWSIWRSWRRSLCRTGLPVHMRAGSCSGRLSRPGPPAFRSARHLPCARNRASTPH
jgi:NAD(P)H-dependent flavin oxidoreductase YrpB (nitropropane dioxygenase family)